MRIFTIIIALCLASSLLKAQPEGFKELTNLDVVKAKMKQVGENQNTIQSTFIQTKKMVYLDVAITSSGNFWYSKPTKVRWEYVEPYDYTIIINNGKLSLISGSSQNDFNLENSEVFEQINTLMVGSITGSIFNSPDYDITVFESNKQYLFSLKPQADFLDGVLTGIKMFLNKETGIVEKIQMIESDENFTEITFSNIKLNETIPDKVFIP